MDPSIRINHSINLVGFGTNEKWGDYWIIKNSWNTWWQDGGFVYMARGVNCGKIAQHGGRAYTYVVPEKYYDERAFPRIHPQFSSHMALNGTRKTKQ